MTRFASDPLLTIARGLVLILMTIMGIAAAAALIGAPLVAIFHDSKALNIADSSGVALSPEVIAALVVVLLLAAVILALAFIALRLLLRVVGTLAEGDPFVPANGERLTRMAWIMLAVQLLQIPLFGLGAWIEEGVDASGQDLHVAVNADFSALLLVLILFILARVFKKGAEMRAELEGTV